MSTEVIRIVFTVEDIEQLINEVDENRGADNEPPLDRVKALDAALKWAKQIEATATSLVDEQLSSVIDCGQP